MQQIRLRISNCVPLRATHNDSIAADYTSCFELANTERDSTSAHHKSRTHKYHEMDIYSQSSAEFRNEIEETSETI